MDSASNASAQSSGNPTKHETTVLVLQGGGALGAYQGGVYEGLAEAGIVPDWIAGVSIGAINAALIAGNPPQRRVERLREFWDRFSSMAPVVPPMMFGPFRPMLNYLSATAVAAFSVPGFFHAANATAILCIRRQRRRAKPLRYHSSQAHSRGVGRFRPDQSPRCAFFSWRREHKDGQLRLLRQSTGQDPPRSRARQRFVAPQFCADRNR